MLATSASLGDHLGSGLLWIALAVPVLVAVHELGHVVGGWLVGFQFLQVRVGPLVVDRPFRVSLRPTRGQRPLGWAWMAPVEPARLPARAAVLVAAGPGANLLLSAALAFGPGTGFARVLLVLSLVFALVNLIPFRSRVHCTDGAWLWMALRRPAWVRRRLATMRLLADFQACVPPERWPAAWIAEATGLVDDSPETLQAHMLAYTAASCGERDAEAAQWLEACLRLVPHGTAALRDVLVCEAAYFHARRRRSAEVAEHWLADASPGCDGSSARLSAEAAILQARGDIDGALARLEEVERRHAKLPPETRRAVLALLDRWRSELRDSPREVAPASA